MADSESDVQNIAHFTYIWTIENICACDHLFSPLFSVGKAEWRLWLACGNISRFMELEILRSEGDDGPDNIEIKFELSFLRIDGLPLIKKLNNKQFHKGARFQFRKFADQEEVFVQKRTEFLRRDTLTVRCRMWRTGTDISKQELCFARTLLREFRGSCISEIREFSTFQEGQKNEVILNPTSEEAIPLILNFFIRREDDQHFLCIDIRNNDKIKACNGKIKISVLDVKGNVAHSEEKYKFSNYSTLHFEDFFEIRKLMDDKASLLPGDVLSLRFEYEIVAVVWSKTERCVNSSEFQESTSEMGKKDLGEKDGTYNAPSSTTEALKILLKEGVLSDVSLRAGSKSFPAHKCILSVRSPVFKAMFSGDMKEKTSKCVEIPDVDENTLRGLLSYIYTDTVGELEWRGAADLYRAADKFELPDLKRRCATTLKSDLSMSSVCAVLIVADMHQDGELRETAQDFIMRQGAEFLTSDTWRSFTEENTKLAMETMQQLLYKKYLEC